MVVGMFRVESKRPLEAMTSEPKVFAETETEEQQKLKNKKHGTKQETLKQVCIGYTSTEKRLELRSWE